MNKRFRRRPSLPESARRYLQFSRETVKILQADQLSHVVAGCPGGPTSESTLTESLATC